VVLINTCDLVYYRTRESGDSVDAPDNQSVNFCLSGKYHGRRKCGSFTWTRSMKFNVALKDSFNTTELWRFGAIDDQIAKLYPRT
jgi:hypothetical protein